MWLLFKLKLGYWVWSNLDHTLRLEPTDGGTDRPLAVKLHLFFLFLCLRGFVQSHFLTGERNGKSIPFSFFNRFFIYIYIYIFFLELTNSGWLWISHLFLIIGFICTTERCSVIKWQRINGYSLCSKCFSRGKRVELIHMFVFVSVEEVKQFIKKTQTQREGERLWQLEIVFD